MTRTLKYRDIKSLFFPSKDYPYYEATTNDGVDMISEDAINWSVKKDLLNETINDRIIDAQCRLCEFGRNNLINEKELYTEETPNFFSIRIKIKD